MRNQKLWAAAFCLGSQALAGCANEDVVPYVGSEVEGHESSLWANTSKFWTSHKVPVCWENPDTFPAEQRDWVRQALERTWSFAGNVEFTGWGTCAAAPAGATTSGTDVRIYQADFGPVALALGTDVAGRVHGVILNHTFKNVQITTEAHPEYNWVISCSPSSTAEQLRACVENIAIHEFGHVLGFHHEQNVPNASSEPDFPSSTCPQHVQTVPDAGEYTLYNNDWDLNSVMNYCSPAYGSSNLSPVDFAATQSFYGVSPKLVGALVGASVI